MATKHPASEHHQRAAGYHAAAAHHHLEAAHLYDMGERIPAKKHADAACGHCDQAHQQTFTAQQYSDK